VSRRGEGGRTIAQSRDVTELISEHSGRARDALRREPPPPEWQRTGLVAWDFGELPRFIVRRVFAAEVRSYPALIDRQKSVDLGLFETERAAEAATRLGVRRLLMLAARQQLSVFAKLCPPPLRSQGGLLVPRAEVEAFREQFLARVVEEAFGSLEGAALPRSKAAFDALLALGTPQIGACFKRLERATVAASSELVVTLRALDSAAKHPSATAASIEIRAQLAELFPRDLMASVELTRLEHFPRYLRAAQARLARAISDPRKDAEKFAPFAALWSAFLDKHGLAGDRAAARSLRWAFEELRVAIFAPELKPAGPVSLASVTSAMSALR
jgi:ATP-dependent helicase HrpA